MKDATLAQGNQVLNLILQKQVSVDQLQRLIGSGLLSDLLEANVERVDRDDFRKVIGLVPSTFLVTVDYALSLEGMVKAGGYDWVNSDITPERFPIKGKGRHELSVELFHFNHFNRIMESDDVISEMDKRGYRPANIEELLALGAQHPDLRREYPIGALGSGLGDRNVPCLWGGSGKRRLDLHWFGGGWDAGCRFLAVRK